MDLKEKLYLLPKTIKFDDTFYTMRIVPLTNDFWELSYFKLNDNGDKNKENKPPVLAYFMNTDIELSVDQAIEWVKNKNLNKNDESTTHD